MVYLDSFKFPSQRDEDSFFTFGSSSYSSKNLRTCYSTKYPFGMFYERGLPQSFEFRDITIFCGNNGSGKSTILNVMAETLGLKRTSLYNRSDFFEDYIKLCKFTLNEKLSLNSAVITSDDVFERVLDIRRINDGIDDKREDLLREWLDNHEAGADNKLHGLSDYNRWKKVSDSQNKNMSQSQFLRKHLKRNIEERSNGESSLSLFVDAIKDDALYLLDEPENSLSPENQLQLKYFIEDSVRYHGCQFIVSTHSPFLLSLKGARIYDLDTNPVKISKWTDLDSVNVYKSFFEENSFAFEKG